MVFQMVLLKLADWILYQLLANSCYRAVMKMRSYGLFLKNQSLKSSPQQAASFPNVIKCGLENRGSDTFDYELKLRAMIFITFCGLRLKDMENVSRAVLPKFYLENLHLKAFEVLASTGSRFAFTSIPRVMVEGFLKEYLQFDNVTGTELHTFGNYFTGLVSEPGLVSKHRALKDYFGDKKPDIGLGSPSLYDHLFISLCKEAYVVSSDVDGKSGTSSAMPRDRYPKPLVFHDGRLAFLPTPLATLSMFLWLPIGVFLALFRLFAGIYLPYKLALFLGIWSGVDLRVRGCSPSRSGPRKGILYVCTHRTLLDPVFLSTSLGQPLTAVTYSLSKMSEVIAPIKTVRLTRERNQDGNTMRRLLSEELASEIVPVAMNTRVSMFYGTTASGLKCLDPIFFLMNPRPSYHIQILEKLPRELTCDGGRSSCEVANYIQRKLADALGFECTTLTRKDKYMMLAGNEGIVQDERKKSQSIGE
ncbi:hypothetical protein OIU84_005459 [Salix udensis]|uniref:Glycerol-3-phosphate acyltransferase RAM2/GPAT1-8 HAD-like domain-containing protein n=1 Tax=Salix udensis TaxID=889485 RepID=A0AAD6JW39_9ROSI|nr:hypothetical protein OIU84_005459 [Salix udensis]